MKYYVFMDNYRGFSETVIPLTQATFLVGENSTGKTSFLSLLYLLSTPNFWFAPGFSPTDFCDLGGFKDIVSAGSSDKSAFTVGLLSTASKQAERKAGSDGYRLSLMTFREKNGLPRLSSYVEYRNGKVFKIRFGPKTMRYKRTEGQIQCDDEHVLVRSIHNAFSSDASDTTGFIALPREAGPYPPLPIVMAFLQSLGDDAKTGDVSRLSYLLPNLDVKWFAPIRTKPSRTYAGFKTDFTPEGVHTPYIIRKILRSRGDRARDFAKLLREFGVSSGLFKNVTAHSFGKALGVPFEVVVELEQVPLNLTNVGYGVSQVLPLVVEMLTSPKGRWFAIQQPEVHLHPKAQAALGDLMHRLARETDHHYVVETHSDYLVDRFRLGIKKTGYPKDTQVLFFERTNKGNVANVLRIDESGRYPEDQPKSFRDFFIHEDISLLEI